MLIREDVKSVDAAYKMVLSRAKENIERDDIEGAPDESLDTIYAHVSATLERLEQIQSYCNSLKALPEPIDVTTKRFYQREDNKLLRDC
jgi:hypothetical protein